MTCSNIERSKIDKRKLRKLCRFSVSLVCARRCVLWSSMVNTAHKQTNGQNTTQTTKTHNSNNSNKPTTPHTTADDVARTTSWILDHNTGKGVLEALLVDKDTLPMLSALPPPLELRKQTSLQSYIVLQVFNVRVLSLFVVVACVCCCALCLLLCSVFVPMCLSVCLLCVCVAFCVCCVLIRSCVRFEVKTWFCAPCSTDTEFHSIHAALHITHFHCPRSYVFCLVLLCLLCCCLFVHAVCC